MSSRTVNAIVRRSVAAPWVVTASLALTGAAAAQTEPSPSDVDFAAALFEFAPGQWGSSVTFDGAAAPTSIQMCVDATVARLASVIASRITALGDPGCRLEAVQKAGAMATFAVACARPGENAFKIKSKVSKVSDGEYVLDTTVTGKAKAESKVVNTIRRIGACAADQQPGDMTAVMSGKPVKLPNMGSLFQTRDQ